MDQPTRQRCETYAEALSAKESPAQAWIRDELERRELPLIQISPLEGKLLAILVRSIDAERVLEIGTLGGYSALWLVSLLSSSARMVTLEKREEHAELAREAFARAGEDRIELRLGDARETLAELGDAPAFDAVFIDADKESYPSYLEAATSLLRPGGLVLGDNAFMDGRAADPPASGAPGGATEEDPAADPDGEAARDPGVRGMREFNRRLSEAPEWDSVFIPVRDGLAVGRRREDVDRPGTGA